MPVQELEKELLVNPGVSEQGEHFAIGELDKITRLIIRKGVIATTPVNGLSYSNVKEMRVYGDHEATFPREGVRLYRPGERPIESVSVEEHPQNLVLSGVVEPRYNVRNMKVDFNSYTAEGMVDGSILNAISPTTFSIWAEYISEEEMALLKSKLVDKKPERKIGVGRLMGKVVDLVIPGMAIGLAASVTALLGYIVSSPVSSGIVYIPSMSPNVKLVFPDGRVDETTGAQVRKYNGKILSAGDNPRIETNHYGEEILFLPPLFTVDGDFFVEGLGRWSLPQHTAHVYGGKVSGRLDFNNGRGYLVGNMQA
ncbi:MAG: hypothetical protein HYT70_03570 [Candidatus Aenigmarchaeota archaeon]|nr:hypothetical protein [Candidatus Aenigmarchaeota archaeon]